MNDFTKEELESMRNQIFSCMGSSTLWRTPENQLLVNKLQSLIDNYCEPMNKDNPMYRCIRCESKAVDIWYEIKYGLHNWFLCTECTPQFRDWVLDKNADNGCPWAKEHFKRKYGDKNDSHKLDNTMLEKLIQEIGIERDSKKNG